MCVSGGLLYSSRMRESHGFSHVFGPYINAPRDWDAVSVTMASQDVQLRETVSLEVVVNLTMLQLLCDMWQPKYSASRNLRLISAFLAHHNANQTENPDAQCMIDGRRMRRVITELQNTWMDQKASEMLKPTCSKEELREFVGKYVTPRINALLTEPFLSQYVFCEWVRNYWQYLGNINKKKEPITQMDVGKEEEEDENDVDDNDENPTLGGGLDELFKTPDNQQEEEEEDKGDRFSQYITKLDNGKLLTMKSPGEVGSQQLIRMYVYDVKDIKKKDKREWWKYARLRTQFLNSTSCKNRKHQILRRLLDEAANDLRKVPGVRREAMNVARDG